MYFFSSIFSDDPETSETDSPSISSPKQPTETPTDPNTSPPESPNPSTDPTSPESPDDIWNFGGLIKTIATRSESVIGNYRRDFEEFGSGLLKETVTIRDVASRAVQEFPDSIDAGAAVAQESLESVGQVIDNLGSSVWQGTAKIIAHGKDLHIFDDDYDEYESGGYDDDGNYNDGYNMSERTSLNVKKYSWYDTRMREIQSDARTYTEDPDDAEDYGKWRSGFSMDDKGEEIQRLIGEERMVERIYLELVPVTVDKESFWCRYFYKVDKVKQAEEARARIVKRAISGQDEEEDLSWDVDDEDDEPSSNDDAGGIPCQSAASAEKEMVRSSTEKKIEEENKDIKVAESENKDSKVAESENKDSKVTESSSFANDENIHQAAATTEGLVTVSDSSSLAKVVDESKLFDEKADNSGDSCKDSDVSIISTQPSFPEVEELGWDEIEDVGSDNDDDDDNNVTKPSISSTVSDLRRRLNVEEDDEDLSWDIEDDDDEPIKS